MPAPGTVLVALSQHLTEGNLLFHLAATLARVLAAFAVAMVVGSIMGIAMGRWRRADYSLDGALVLGLNIPALVIIILCYVWFGLTEAAAILAVSINKIPTVAVTMREGARAVDRQLMDVATAFDLPPSRTLRKVYLPQLYPYFMAAARSGLALTWKVVLVVELLGRSSGVGFQLGLFFQMFDIAGILAYTLAFAAVILTLEAAVLRPADRRVARWRA
uniref:ABC transporter permease n=1 Tax=Chelativorans sp. YIM 93263 TaxID=2906648 RepID=UPI002379DDFB|nr:ABC transporter permease subunit [Chelativorans sp. YIM 93263]